MMKKYQLILLFLALFLSGCKQEELLKGLDQRQANEVVALLQRNNIDSVKKDIAKQGFSVTVDPRDFSAAVDLMDTYGLPRQPNLEIAQMFPADSLVSSPRAEKARLYSGIEQRLAQSLLSIQGVVSARVHVSYDLGAVEGDRKKTPIHISSLLNYDERVNDTTLLIGDVKRFLKNSVEDIDYDNISVVLSRAKDVQRLAPIAIPGRSPSVMSWLFIIIALLFACIMSVMLFIKRGNSSLASKLSRRSHGIIKSIPGENRSAAPKDISEAPPKGSDDAR